MVGKYRVITLCGSTRFKEEFIRAQKELTLEGYIVISVGLFGHGGDKEVWEGMDEGTRTRTKEMLDDMHRRKIDMADEIFVINVGDYIGDSTRGEIAYAKEHGKRVSYLEPHMVMYEDPTDHREGAPLPWANRADARKEAGESCVPAGASVEEGAVQRSREQEKAGEAEDSLRDLELLDGFMRDMSAGPVYAPDAATAAIIAYQNGEEDPEEDRPAVQEPLQEASSGRDAEHAGEEKEKEDEDDAEYDTRMMQRGYVLQMAESGFDVPNTAYALGMREDEVEQILEEAGAKERGGRTE